MELLREKIEILAGKLKDIDSQAVTDLYEILSTCSRCIQEIIIKEAVATTWKNILEPEQYQAKLTEAEKDVKIVQYKLVKGILRLNEYCLKAKIELLYKGNTEDITEVTEFAKKIVDEMVITRRR
ncbi:MAG: hypothetical protein ACM3UU_01415 [Ignavibacteriales bacterium]